MTDVYVDPSFSTASPGDILLWNSAVASRRNVTFGTDGFATLADALTEVDAGGTIWLAGPNDIDDQFAFTLPVVIRGIGASLLLDGPAFVNGAAVRFRDLRIVNNTAAPPGGSNTFSAMVKATAGALVAFTHCSFVGSTNHAAEANGPGTGVVLSGCSYDGSIGPNRAVATDGGAVGVFAKTVQPVGGSHGRNGLHFRHQTIIEAPAEYRSTAKDQKIVWVTVDQCYASLEPLRSDEYTHARLAGADATHRLELPSGLTVTPAFRAVIRGETYLLNAPLSTDSRDSKMAFTALKRVA